MQVLVRICLTAVVAAVIAAVASKAFPLIVGDLVKKPYVSLLQQEAGAAAPKAEVFVSAIAALERSWRWDGNPETGGLLGYAYLYRSVPAAGDSGTIDRASLNKAADRLHASLALRPGYPQGWLWLALVRYLDEAPAESVTEAIDLSLETGPYEPELLVSRLKLMAEYSEYYAAPSNEAALRQQIVYAWPQDPYDVAKLLVDARIVDAGVRALANDKRKLDQLIDIVSRYELLRGYPRS